MLLLTSSLCLFFTYIKKKRQNIVQESYIIVLSLWSRVLNPLWTSKFLNSGLNNMKIKLEWTPLTSIWFVVFLFLSLQKSNLMFKRLDASTLSEDILSNTQTLPMMAHSAGSALWVCVQICYICVSFYMFVYSFLSVPIQDQRRLCGFEPHLTSGTVFAAHKLRQWSKSADSGKKRGRTWADSR